MQGILNGLLSIIFGEKKDKKGVILDEESGCASVLWTHLLLS